MPMHPLRRNRRSSFASSRRSSDGTNTHNNGSIVKSVTYQSYHPSRHSSGSGHNHQHKSLSKLDFSKLQKLYGKDHHIPILQKALQDAETNIVAPPHVIYMHGPPGVGKSALIRGVLRDDKTDDMKDGPLSPWRRRRRSSGMDNSSMNNNSTSGTDNSTDEQSQQEQEEEGKSYYVEGKCSSMTPKPLGAFYTVFSGICRKVPLRDDQDKEVVQWLNQHFEAIDDIMDSYHTGTHLAGDDDDQDDASHSLFTWTSFKTAFRDVLRSLCKPEHPLVIVLDGVDAADAPTLELFQHVATDKGCHGLVLVAVAHESRCPLLLHLRDMDDSLLTKVEVSDLAVNDLQELLADLIAVDGNQAAMAEYASVHELTRAVFDQTQGNVRDSIRYLRLLHDEGFIFVTDPTLNKWEWNMSSIWAYGNHQQVRGLSSSSHHQQSYGHGHHNQSGTGTTHSLAERSSSAAVAAAEHRLQRLPRRTLEILQLAACLGINFDAETIARVDYTTADDVKRLLRAAQELECVVLQSEVTGAYKFTNDKIQQAAYLMNPEGEMRDTQHLRIGRVLRDLVRARREERRNSDGTGSRRGSLGSAGSIPEQRRQEQVSNIEGAPQRVASFQGGASSSVGGGNNNSDTDANKEKDKNKNWALFTAVDQLNLGAACLDDQFEKSDLIRMNQDASDKAIEISAFLPAREYLRSALSLLGNRWEQYSVTLKLCTRLASVECSMGCFDECQQTIDEVMMNTNRLEDKIPVHFTTVEMLSVQGRMSEAMNLCVALLNLLGEPLNVDPNKVQVLNELMKIKRQLRGKTDEIIMNLDEMTVPNTIESMKVLGKLAHMAWWTQQKDLFVVVCSRMLMLTLQNGLHDVSSLGFALYSVVCGSLGNSSEAYRFGKLALALLKQSNSKAYAARTMVVAYGFSCHLKTPLQDALNPLMEAYKIGMEIGDVEYSSQACNVYSSVYLVCGLPLAMVEPDMRKFSQQMKSYNQGTSLSMFRIFHQCILNFMGRSDDALVFEGEAMKEENLIEAHQTKQVTTLLAYWFCRMTVAYHFGDYSLARRMADAIIKNGKSKTMRNTPTSYSRRMIMTLTMLALVDAEKPKQRKASLAQARKLMKLIESMAKEKNLNSAHSLMLVKAEFAALKRSKSSHDKVRSLYDKAIATASRLGFLHDAALANQRAGFYMIRHNQASYGEDYIRRAHELYSDWGADAKAQQLEASFPFLLKDGNVRRGSGTYHLARRRFDGGKTKMHKAIQLTGGTSFCHDDM